MTSIAIKDLLEAGVHFGHQTKRWNPKMKQYIFGARNGIYIIDLSRTAELFGRAEAFVRGLAAEGKTVLFVGTKRQAQDLVVEEARRCGMFFVNQRWLGGLLTNFVTIQRSIARLRDMEAMAEDGPVRHVLEEGNRQNREGKAEAAQEPGRHPSHVQAPGRGVRGRHAEGEDRRRRSAKAEDSGHRPRRHELQPGRRRLRDSRQRRRVAVDPPLPVPDCRRRHRRPRSARIVAEGARRPGGRQRGGRPPRRTLRPRRRLRPPPDGPQRESRRATATRVARQHMRWESAGHAGTGARARPGRLRRGERGDEGRSDLESRVACAPAPCPATHRTRSTHRAGSNRNRHSER